MAHQMGLKRKVQESAASAAAPPGTSGGALSEEEQLNMAIAMSMQAAGRGGAGGAGSGDVGPPELDDLDEAAIWEQVGGRGGHLGADGWTRRLSGAGGWTRRPSWGRQGVGNGWRMGR
eukprot:366214-Chlamydomonas_euryale.AAC.11